ncbi:UNVERIFIED_CONTAM: hypothetical protein K2H54_041518 [Gekko kuhli]
METSNNPLENFENHESANNFVHVVNTGGSIGNFQTARPEANTLAGRSKLCTKPEDGRNQETARIGTAVATNKLGVVSASQFIPTEQYHWIEELRTKPVVINHQLVVDGSKDTGADLSSIHRDLPGENIQYEGFMMVDPYESTSRLIPLVKLHVRFRNWEGEQLILVHEDTTHEFVIGVDLLYKASSMGGVQTRFQRRQTLDMDDKEMLLKKASDILLTNLFLVGMSMAP